MSHALLFARNLSTSRIPLTAKCPSQNAGAACKDVEARKTRMAAARAGSAAASARLPAFHLTPHCLQRPYRIFRLKRWRDQQTNDPNMLQVNAAGPGHRNSRLPDNADNLPNEVALRVR